MKSKAFTFIDIIVGIGLILILFLGIYGAYQLGMKAVGQSRNKIVATAIANQWLEKVRNLPYQSIGVKGGFPDGVLDSATTTIINNIEYTIENRVDFVVDPADGIAPPDDDCPNDYKRVEVRVSWAGRFSGEIELSTDVAPKNLAEECEVTGGILSVSVFDAYGVMVPSPLIEVKDPDTDETLKTATPTDGQHYFSLATSTYKVVVSKSGYSSERTYGLDEIAIPEKPHPLVLEGQLTEISFSIDKVSTFSVETLSPWGVGFFSDSFDDETKISEKFNVVVSGGEVNLSKSPGVYFKDGTTDADLCAFPGIDGDCGQSFTMGSQSKEISQVQLYLRKATTDPSDIWLEIRSDSTIGPVIASSTLMDSNTLPINLEWITFTFQNPVTLDANTQYFLRLSSSPPSTDPEAGAEGYIYWGYIHSDTAPPAYAGGDAWRYIGRNLNPDDPGQQLGPEDQYDFSFIIYDDVYVPSGYLVSTAITPEELRSWDEFSFSDSEPQNTDLRYQIYYATDTDWLLIPDSDLPGNSQGFDLSPVDLSGLNVNKYSSLKIRANFSTAEDSVTPTLKDWQVSWITSKPTPINNVTFHLQGEKIIGLDANENPVYKYSKDHTTTGHRIDITDLEWDNYTFSVDPATDLDLVDTDPSPQPISLAPDTTLEVDLYLEAENSLLVTVQDGETLEPIFSAEVRLYNLSLGYDTTQYTDENGQTYFIPLESADYNLEISAPGYASYFDTVSVSGDVAETYQLQLSE